MYRMSMNLSQLEEAYLSKEELIELLDVGGCLCTPQLTLKSERLSADRRVSGIGTAATLNLRHAKAA